MAHDVDKIILTAEQLQHREDLLFLILGEGAQKQTTQEMVTSRKLKDVRVLLWVNKEKVRDYYALSDINLVTMRKTDLFKTVIPSKIFEIMAMGRPIITTVNGECRQIIENAGAGVFVEPENVEQLAATISELSHKSDLLTKMGASGRKHINKYFSREVLATRYLNLLQKVATSGARIKDARIL
jgi:glycosyltransferase involved in cell wall biosynthesis